jgi:hypothetical protein
VFGDLARNDHEITEKLSRLRRDANWAYLKPQRSGLHGDFLARVRAYVGRAEPGSLAALAAAAHSSPGTFPEDQLAHWLFAFDAGGMASFRALAPLDELVPGPYGRGGTPSSGASTTAARGGPAARHPQPVQA